MPDPVLIDPASGTSGFLRGCGASLSHILAHTSQAEGTPNEDLDQIPERAATGITCRDTLTMPHEDTSGYDLVITNPPFNGATDAESNTQKGKLKTGKTELLFIERALAAAQPSGRACVLVPAGVLFSSSKPHRQARRLMIEENCLEAVIHVPAGAFKPYSGSATSVLLLRAGEPMTERVWFDEITSVGYTLNNKRRPTSDNDIPDVLKRWRNRNALENPERTGKGFFVGVEELRQSDYVLQLSRYQEFVMPAAVDTRKPEELLLEIARIEIDIMNGLRKLAESLGCNLDELIAMCKETPAE